MKKFYKKRGFTLIELVVSTALILTVFTILSTIFLNTLKTSKLVSTSDEMYNDSYFALNYIYGEISSADYIIANKNSESLGFTLVNLMGVDKSEKRKSKNSKYKYIYYVTKGNTLKRYALNTNSKITSGEFYGKFGVNNIISGVDKVSCKFERDKIIMEFDFNRDNVKDQKTLIIANRTFEEFK